MAYRASEVTLNAPLSVVSGKGKNTSKGLEKGNENIRNLRRKAKLGEVEEASNYPEYPGDGECKNR